MEPACVVRRKRADLPGVRFGGARSKRQYGKDEGDENGMV
jgi:hypothetical protein